jgi:hypothetical protein
VASVEKVNRPRLDGRNEGEEGSSCDDVAAEEDYLLSRDLSDMEGLCRRHDVLV